MARPLHPPKKRTTKKMIQPEGEVMAEPTPNAKPPQAGPAPDPKAPVVGKPETFPNEPDKDPYQQKPPRGPDAPKEQKSAKKDE